MRQTLGYLAGDYRLELVGILLASPLNLPGLVSISGLHTSISQSPFCDVQFCDVRKIFGKQAAGMAYILPTVTSLTISRSGTSATIDREEVRDLWPLNRVFRTYNTLER